MIIRIFSTLSFRFDLRGRRVYLPLILHNFLNLLKCSGVINPLPCLLEDPHLVSLLEEWLRHLVLKFVLVVFIILWLCFLLAPELILHLLEFNLLLFAWLLRVFFAAHQILEITHVYFTFLLFFDSFGRFLDAWSHFFFRRGFGSLRGELKNVLSSWGGLCRHFLLGGGLLFLKCGRV